MKRVRFTEKYCADLNNRMSYELVSDERNYPKSFVNDKNELCYDLKLLGLIPIRKLEEADGTEIPAIEIFVKLTNL